MSDDESYNDNASVISNISYSTSNEERSGKYSVNYMTVIIGCILKFNIH